MWKELSLEIGFLKRERLEQQETLKPLDTTSTVRTEHSDTDIDLCGKWILEIANCSEWSS